VVNRNNNSIDNFVQKHQNKVMGLVYFGASFLIIIVGLRGLGTLAGQLSVIPSFLVDSSGKIDPNWVILALLVEFIMLTLLAVFTFLNKEIENGKTNFSTTQASQIHDLRNELSKLKDFSREELDIIKTYLKEFEEMQEKINHIQTKNMMAIKNMKEMLNK
jgi:hypothetical protein